MLFELGAIKIVYTYNEMILFAPKYKNKYRNLKKSGYLWESMHVILLCDLVCFVHEIHDNK